MPPKQERAAPRMGLHILVAEDNGVNQTVVTGMLRKMGHTAKMADDGREALQLLAKSAFDLVLMDVQMPVMDGLNATRKIRENEKLTQTRMPIIALTAHVLQGDREHCLAAGMDGYVPKPIDQRVLSETIQEVLNALDKPPEVTKSTGAPVQPPVQEKSVSWDVAATLAKFGGDEAMLRTVVGQYLKSIPFEMTQLRQAVMQGCARDLASTANCLKGEIGYLAIPAFFLPVCELEAMGRGGDLRNAARVLAELEPVVAGVMNSIEKVDLMLGKTSLSAELVTK
jgi:CheY-like chemotaxis protein